MLARDLSIAPQPRLRGQRGPGVRPDHARRRAAPAGLDVRRLDAVEQVPEDLGLAHQRRRRTLLQLARRRVRDHEGERLLAVAARARHARPEVRERLRADPRVVLLPGGDARSTSGRARTSRSATTRPPRPAGARGTARRRRRRRSARPAARGGSSRPPRGRARRLRRAAATARARPRLPRRRRDRGCAGSRRGGTPGSSDLETMIASLIGMRVW